MVKRIKIKKKKEPEKPKQTRPKVAKTKSNMSMYLDNDLIKEIRRVAREDERSASYLVNTALREKFLPGVPKPKKYLDPDFM